MPAWNTTPRRWFFPRDFLGEVGLLSRGTERLRCGHTCAGCYSKTEMGRNGSHRRNMQRRIPVVVCSACTGVNLCKMLQKNPVRAQLKMFRRSQGCKHDAYGMAIERVANLDDTSTRCSVEKAIVGLLLTRLGLHSNSNLDDKCSASSR
jgi:hypothetical protein